VKYTVRKIRLSGDYETGTGRYYGGPGPVYRAVDCETDNILIEFRARTRAEALFIAKRCAAKAEQLGTTMDRVPQAWY
jgi:hypothetical protein